MNHNPFQTVQGAKLAVSTETQMYRDALKLADLSLIEDVTVRWRAWADWQTAVACRQQARRLVRDGGPGWRFSHRLELRRAIRFWQHYARAVRHSDV